MGRGGGDAWAARRKPIQLVGFTKATAIFLLQPIPALDSYPGLSRFCSFTTSNTMGQQSNKVIKRKRREAYLKRRKVAVALAAKKTKGAKK